MPDTRACASPPPGPQLCLLSQSLRCRDASLLPALLFSNHPHTHPPRPRLRLPAAPGDQEEPVSEPRVGPHALVVEFILVAGNWMYFPCIHIGVALHSCCSILASLDCWSGVRLPSGLSADGQRIPEVLHSSPVAAPLPAPVTQTICLQKVQEPWKGQGIRRQEEERERVRQFGVNDFSSFGGRRGHNQMALLRTASQNC